MSESESGKCGGEEKIREALYPEILNLAEYFTGLYTGGTPPALVIRLITPLNPCNPKMTVELTDFNTSILSIIDVGILIKSSKVLGFPSIRTRGDMAPPSIESLSIAGTDILPPRIEIAYLPFFTIASAPGILPLIRSSTF